MQMIAIAGLLIAGVIHILPLAGILGADRIASLYGIPVADPNIEILMRHRALLFGLLGGFICASIWIPAWRPLAIGAGLLSAFGFAVVCISVGGWNAALQRVLIADVIVIACLLAAGILLMLKPGLTT